MSGDNVDYPLFSFKKNNEFIYKLLTKEPDIHKVFIYKKNGRNLGLKVNLIYAFIFLR